MKEKTRQSETHLSCESWVTRNSTGATIDGPHYYDYDVITTDESIVYANRWQRFNPCIHKKWKAEWHTPLAVGCFALPDDHTDHTNVVKAGLVAFDSPSAVLNLISSAVGHSGFNWGNFAQRAIEKMTPTLESGFSLGNFLFELKEIKSLVKWWNSGRSYMDNLANNTLNYSFGLRPFLMDLRNLAKGLYKFREKLAELKAGAGKLQVRHYSEETSYLDGDTFLASGAMEYRGNWFVPKCKWTATMVYTYQFPEIDKGLNDLYRLYVNENTSTEEFLALLDSIGANLNPQIIWDAIPYSFVVDWFFNVGDWLRQWRRKWIEVALTIKDFGVSVKFPYHGYTEFRLAGFRPSAWLPRHEFFGSYYHRFPLKIDDRSFTVSQTGELTFRKFILGSLLIRQRL